MVVGVTGKLAVEVRPKDIKEDICDAVPRLFGEDEEDKSLVEPNESIRERRLRPFLILVAMIRGGSERERLGRQMESVEETRGRFKSRDRLGPEA